MTLYSREHITDSARTPPTGLTSTIASNQDIRTYSSISRTASDVMPGPRRVSSRLLTFLKVPRGLRPASRILTDGAYALKTSLSVSGSCQGCEQPHALLDHISCPPELSDLASGLKRVAALFFGRECTILRQRLVKDFAA